MVMRENEELNELKQSCGEETIFLIFFSNIYKRDSSGMK